MKRHARGSFAVGLLLVMALLASSAVPGYAQRGGGSSHAAGGAPGWAWHRGGGWHGGWWGPRVFIGPGFAAPAWRYPYYGYPYPYAYPYPYGYPTYSVPAIRESSPQTYIQQEPPAQQDWYYCQSAQSYYPDVRECPDGWQQVAPQPPPPPR